MYGDNEFYDPQTSPIANLFALDRPEPRNHFLLPITLDYVLSRGGAKDSAGYVEIADVYHHLQGHGFSLEAVSFALNYLARFRLIEAPLSDFNVAHADRARITTVGAYTLKNLPVLFTYSDAVLVDTPIIDQGIRARIGKVYSIVDRLSRVEVFREYLDSCWGQAGLGTDGWTWPPFSTVLAADVAAIRTRTGAKAE